MPMTASPRGLIKRVHGRADVAEVARVDDDLDVRVARGDPLENFDGRSREELSMKMCS